MTIKGRPRKKPLTPEEREKRRLFETPLEKSLTTEDLEMKCLALAVLERVKEDMAKPGEDLPLARVQEMNQLRRMARWFLMRPKDLNLWCNYAQVNPEAFCQEVRATHGDWSEV